MRSRALSGADAVGVRAAVPDRNGDRVGQRVRKRAPSRNQPFHLARARRGVANIRAGPPQPGDLWARRICARLPCRGWALPPSKVVEGRSLLAPGPARR